MAALSGTEAEGTKESFAALLEESLGSGSGLEGTVVKGRVIAIENDMVLIDVGLKSEGRVALKEFTPAGKAPEIKAGDTVEVYLERMEDKNGDAQLSREKARREEAWTQLEKHFQKNERVTGIIFGRVKGGFTVDLNGAVAFLPGSQVDIRPVRDVGPLMGSPQPFQILKMDRSRGNIVVSRRAVLEESRAEQRSELVASLKEGQILSGVVKNITDYGAFVDLGGVDGLLHVTDIAWRRINHPSEALQIGQQVKVQVIRFNSDTQRISLGMKQLEADPWEGVAAKYPPGARYSGRVTNITDYGAFVELEPGVEGLVHVSEMSWTKKNVHPGKIVSTSQEVDVMVLDVDSGKRRISLGLKQVQRNPWEQFVDEHPIGTEVEGEIRNITEFGLFIGLSPDIDGMIHMSDISWDEPGELAIARYEKGQIVKAKVLDVDVEHLGLHHLAFFVARDGKLARLIPGDVGHVDHAVDIRRQANEQPELRDIADFSLDLGPDRMLVDELLPGIPLHLLQAERDAALRGVHIQHHHLHLLAGGDDLAGMHVLFRPRHLADMHQAFDARLKFHERAVVGDVGHAPGELRAHRILGGHAIPRIRFKLLHAQADALRVRIEPDHLHLDLLANLQRLGRMVDPPPCDIGHVQQPVHAAEIHEGAVVGDVLHYAVQDLAFLQPLDQLGALLGAGLFQHRAARYHDIAARPVHLQDLERLRRLHQRPDIADRADIDLAARQECHGAVQIDGEAAFHPAIDPAVDPLLGLERLLEVGPRLLTPRLLARQDDGAVLVLVALDIQLDDIAGLYLGLGARWTEFLQRDAAFGLQAYIDDGEFIGEPEDPTRHDRPVEAGILAKGLIEEGGEILAFEVVLHRGRWGSGAGNSGR